MTTPAQIRGACAMLGLSAADISDSSGLQIQQVESVLKGHPASDIDVLSKLKDALERRGIVFLGNGAADSGGGPGIRLRATQDEEGIRPENLNATNDD